MQQNKLRARCIDMTEPRRAAQGLLPISSVYYSLARIGEMYVFERPHRLFGLAVAYAPHRSDRPSMARSNSRPRSVGILRVRGLPLLRRVQVSATTFNWIIAFIADKACGVVPVAACEEHEVFGPVEVAGEQPCRSSPEEDPAEG
jgi:hypothetical protein